MAHDDIAWPGSELYRCKWCTRVTRGYRERLPVKTRPGWQERRRQSQWHFWHLNWVYLDGDDYWALHCGFFPNQEAMVAYMKERPGGPRADEWQPTDRSA